VALDLVAASKARLLDLLKERSFEEREVTLASGRKSNFYIDCKQTTLDGEGHVLVGRLLYHALDGFDRKSGRIHDAIGGLTLGADPIASAVAMTAALAGRSLPAFIVRKEPKGHGTGAYIEGMKNLRPGGRLAIVEDVVTTGGSAEKAILRAREAGFTVELVLALVDRLEGGREALEANGCTLLSLFDREDFLPSR
jgi:orotate phosphoribosyltransferase